MTLTAMEMCRLIEVGVKARCKRITLDEVAEIVDQIISDIAWRNDQEFRSQFIVPNGKEIET